MPRQHLRRHLSMPGLLEAVRKDFKTVSERIKPRKYSLTDVLSCGLGIFAFKFPSLLQFDNVMRGQDEDARAHNLRSLLKVDEVPCDTCLRERLDQVDPRELRTPFKTVHAQLQRGKVLEGMTVLGGHCLLAADGTGIHSSKSVNCDRCCTKNHRDGTTTYQHQMFAGALMHPAVKAVFPFAPEMILRNDGASKNDCERNAAGRFFKDFRREHPHLKVIVVQDGLASNGPHIKLLRSLNLRFILGAKPGDHAFMFNWANSRQEQSETWVVREGSVKGTTIHSFRCQKDVPINSTHFDEAVTLVEYSETKPNGKTANWAWVTDLEVTSKTVMEFMRSARRRWSIENQVFKTLKGSTGSHFEHNFGHGHKHLCSVMGSLALLAMLIDQVQAHCCPLFRQARDKLGAGLYLWNEIRGLLCNFLIPDWETLWNAIILGYNKPPVEIRPQPP